jgi:hypothetical protein
MSNLYFLIGRCPDCIDTGRMILRKLGLKEGEDYTVLPVRLKKNDIIDFVTSAKPELKKINTAYLYNDELKKGINLRTIDFDVDHEKVKFIVNKKSE